MKYSFVVLEYADDVWRLRPHDVLEPRDRKVEQKNKGPSVSYVEYHLEKNELWALAREQSEHVAALIYTQRGTPQRVILDDDAFIAMVQEHGGAGTLGTYHIRRREPKPNAPWYVERSPYEEPETRNAIEKFETKSEARKTARDWHINRTNTIGILEYHWKTGDITNVWSNYRMWDWIHVSGREM